jgi:dimethylargininase
MRQCTTSDLLVVIGVLTKWRANSGVAYPVCGTEWRRGLSMLRNEGQRLSRVVVCTPGDEYCQVNDLERHNIKERANPRRAIEQHDTLKRCLTDFGAEVIDAPELAGHPNSVFTRDTALCTPDGYIKLRLGLQSRRGEEAWMGQILDTHGEPLVGEIKQPGTVEGGDVILAGLVAFVGRSIRTNEDGVEQLADLLSAMEYDVRVVQLPDSILHLDKAMMLVGPDRVIHCCGLIPDGTLRGFEAIELECAQGATANVICLGENEAIVELSNQEAASQLRAHGVVVHELDLSEFVKGSGGPNCLIMPVERQ